MRSLARIAALTGTILLVSICFSLSLKAQSQSFRGFNYQAVARNLSGSPIIDKPLDVRIGIHAGGMDGELVWGEEHQVVTNPLGLFTLVVGDPNALNQTGSVDAFDQIDWSAGPYFLRVWVRTDGEYMDLGGSPIQTVPMAHHAASASSAAGHFKIQPSADHLPGEALFEVKRPDGQPVFAVYEDMVWVYVDPDSTKGVKGGFAVGGYRPSKGITEEYMRVTSDSVRVYVNDDPVKGVKGGFAVGGYRRSAKGPSQEFLRVTPDSVRVYIDSDPEAKGVKSGFAVGGYNRSAKSFHDDLFLNVSGKSTVDVIDDESQIMWYPLKEAFLAGRIHVGSVDSVGRNSMSMGYKPVAMGNFSQAFGFKSMSLGDYSTAFGRESVAEAENSYALGSGSVASGYSSMALGTNSDALSNYSTAIGYRSVASGRYAHAFGLASEATGERAMALGMVSRASGLRSLSMGYVSEATQPYSLAIGPNAMASGDTAISIGSSATASGPNSVALGTGTVASDKLATAIGYNASAEGFRSISLGSYYNKYLTFILPIFPIYPLTLSQEEDPQFDGLKQPDASKGTFVTLPLLVERSNQSVGSYSIAVGNGNLSENGGISLGVFNDALDIYATAVGFGNQAVAPYSFAAGFANKTEGHYASAIGRYTSAASMNSLAIGIYNRSYGTADDWIATDPLFQIGNGSGPDISDQHDAFRVDKNGQTNIYPTTSSRGINLYGVNTGYNSYHYQRITSENTRSSVYGLYSRVYSTDSDISNIYSGYFSGYNSAGSYWGLYADQRSGDAIDVAEYIYDSNGDTEAGDVLVADPAREESVIRSSEPYQTSVLGVVSTEPHMVMGMELVVDKETGEPIPGVSATRLALTGRVPVKVTGENGSIEPGDLLTTSSTPGHAMKWSLLDVSRAADFEELKSMLSENERRRNAVIGKAVGSSAGGTGKVMVLISLQ